MDYMSRAGHEGRASAPLVPPRGDGSLLFVNAGMVPYKDSFLGRVVPPAPRVASVQKCVRAGGKHNDLDNVGHTARHHTFFEMLGNFSFGSYFKEDAIRLAWTYLTRELGLPKERLLVSVHHDDREAANIWHAQEGVPLDRIVYKGDEDNFWSMGDGPGPCGPCTEIFWDQQQEVDGDRFLEIWNLVFMQYQRTESGELQPLDRPCVDTGMGLERIASVLQGVRENYDIDTIRGLVHGTRTILHDKFGGVHQPQAQLSPQESVALKVIVDHVRASCFLIGDGVIPSNVSRGYVLRRIIRRAARYANTLAPNRNQGLLADVGKLVIAQMGEAYPDLFTRQNVILHLIEKEEEAFLATLEQGLAYLQDALRNNPGTDLPPEVVIHLYIRLGFPIDLTHLIVKENNKTFDMNAVDRLMDEEREKSRAHAFSLSSSAPSSVKLGEGGVPTAVKEWMAEGIAPEFTGYARQVEEETSVVALLPDLQRRTLWLSISPCPFYGMAGGQVGDKGRLIVSGGSGKTLSELRLRVEDSLIPYEGGLVLRVKVDKGEQGQEVSEGELKELADMLIKGQVGLRAEVDDRHRRGVRAHHTATHLLHASLRQVLGTSIVQAGSLVDANRLRFDFTHHSPLTDDQLQRIEHNVREVIAADTPVATDMREYAKAVESGAMCLFSEKYPPVVRVVSVPGFSTELCSGTHAASTGEIRPFKITGQTSVALGIRRIEAVAAEAADQWYDAQYQYLSSLGRTLEVAPVKIEERVKRLLARERELEKEVGVLQRKLASSAANSSASQSLAGTYSGHPLAVHVYPEGDDDKVLAKKAEQLREKEPGSVHVVVSGRKVICTLATDQLPALKANKVLQDMLATVGGKGGGKEGMAQGFLASPDLASLQRWARLTTQ